MPTFNGTPSGETLTGTSGADNLYGLGGNDTLIGLGDNDWLDGGDGSDSMEGGDGSDHYVVDNISDVIIENTGQGDDWVHSSVNYTLAAGVSVETMTTVNDASTATINLTGNEFGQSIYGNAGNNVLNGGGGADYLVGLQGNDHYFIDNGLDRVVELAGQGDDWITALVSYTLAAGVSVETIATINAASTTAINLIGNEFGQSIYGSDGDNLINGVGGSDYLVGLAGNDILAVSGNANRLSGGAGADIFVFVQDSLGNVITDFESGVDKIELGLMVPADFFEWLGTESFTGAIGEARYMNGVFEFDANGDAVADLSIVINAPLAPADFSTNGINGIFSSVFPQNQTINGTSGNDALYGGNGNDRLYGFAGDDSLNGGGGSDTLIGGEGNDYYIVNSGGDEIVELVGQGDDWVTTSASYALSSGASVELFNTINEQSTENLDLTGNAYGQSIYGNSGNNILRGGGGSDYLNGGAGNDILIGGSGNDVFTGGAGNDMFVVNSTSGIDTITDFAGDTINLGLLIGSQQFSFIGANPFSGVAGQGRFANGNFELDLDGNSVADVTIHINGTVTAQSFVFIDDYF